MKILIIGSNGFIGRSCVDYFKNEDLTGADINDNINQGIKFYKLDKDRLDYDHLFKKDTFDICLNVSGTGSVQFSFSDLKMDYKQNVTNVFKILEGIRNNNPMCRFINFSSAAVYGNPEHLPIKEKSKLHPISPYGFHKHISEQICKEFYDIYKIRSVSLRIFSVYGIYQKKLLFWDLFEKIQKNKTINMFGSGKETRDYIYIKDLMKAIHIIIRKSKFDSTAINIANGESIQIETICKTFAKLLNKQDLEIKFNDILQDGYPLDWQADITSLKKMGYIPDYTIEEGLKEYIDWIKKL